MKEEQVKFRSDELSLEGMLVRPKPGGSQPGAVICHPHPMYGGSMHNNVVEAVLDGLWRRGYATLRFNFRGVGGSEGEYDGGAGEADDARAAIAWLMEQPGIRSDAIVLAGYSFGAMVAVRAGFADPAVARLIAVAVPIGMTDFGTVAPLKPILLVSGDRDSYSPIDKLQALEAKLGSSAQLEVVAGADHFFGGYEDMLSGIIERRMAGS